MLEVARCLIIPDLHQNLAWATRILQLEKDCELVVFLGDYFDLSGAAGPHAGAAATCEWLLQTGRDWQDRSIFLLGNHDVQYLEAKPACDRRQTPRNLNYQCGGAFSSNTAHTVAKLLPPEFWNHARLFAAVNGHLLCHAGLARRFWPTATTVASGLEMLRRESMEALAGMARGPHWLLDIGRSRGGLAETGGITWLDWEDEFVDDLPLPQIVGHTGSGIGARRNGRSWCIDGRQTCYGVLTPTSFTVKEA